MTDVATLSRARKSGEPLGLIGRRLLLAYWVVCLAVIALGVDYRFPELRRAVTDAIYGPQLAHPFASCAAAHAAGVYNIRRDSAGYLPSQDADNDGVACEPAPLVSKSKADIVGDLLKEGARPG